MNIAQGLKDSGAIASMAREFGVDEATAQRAAGALLPAIVAGLGRDTVGAGGTRAGGGLGGILGSILGGGAGQRDPLEDILSPNPTPAAQGNDILGQIFGNKDVSRGVAEEAAGASGLPAQLLKQMLPVLAMAVVGMMMRGKGGAGGGLLGGILGQVVASAVRKAI